MHGDARDTSYADSTTSGELDVNPRRLPPEPPSKKRFIAG
jgi:hypothetical protein